MTPATLSLSAAVTAATSGTSIPVTPPSIGWSAYYDNVYRYHWAPKAVRGVWRRDATYMVI